MSLTECLLKQSTISRQFKGEFWEVNVMRFVAKFVMKAFKGYIDVQWYRYQPFNVRIVILVSVEH